MTEGNLTWSESTLPNGAPCIVFTLDAPHPEGYLSFPVEIPGTPVRFEVVFAPGVICQVWVIPAEVLELREFAGVIAGAGGEEWVRKVQDPSYPKMRE